MTTSNVRREFAYLREARQQGQCQLIQLVVNMFNVTDLFLILPRPGHIATLEANMAREYVPVLTADNGVTEKLGARQSCFAPFEMVPLLLGKNLSPHQTFSLVYPWLEPQGLNRRDCWKPASRWRILFVCPIPSIPRLLGTCLVLGFQLRVHCINQKWI